jgi:ribosomal protein S18 acetylase RimI-like enzyme
MSLALRSALYVSMNDLAEAQTTAYGSGWTSSPAKLAEICRVQSIDLGLSQIVFDGRRAVGVALVGSRADHGWLHDIAVAPEYRRSGVGKRLMQAVFDAMRQSGIREVELDVAAMRQDAIGLYSKLGFRRTRSYLNLAATGRELGMDRTMLPPTHTVVAGSQQTLIDAYADTQASEPAPCWDRSLPSLLAYTDGYVSRLLAGEQELGLMHYLARPAAAGDPDRIRPLFVRLAPDADAILLAELLTGTGSAAFGDVGRVTYRIALEPHGSRFARLLAELKVPVVAESYDMRLAL